MPMLPDDDALHEEIPGDAISAGQEIAWSVGPWQCGEFQVLRSVLAADGEWPCIETLAGAIERASNAAVQPEVVLLAQPQPGFYSESEAAAFARLAPLTRIIVVAGTWCEGEVRTGRPLPGAHRLYWYQFAAWWRRALADRAAGRQPAWADPLVDSTFAAAGGRMRRTGGFPALGVSENRVAVDVGDYETFVALQVALKPHGWRCVWQPRHRPEVWSSNRAGGNGASQPVAGIWAGGQFDAAEAESLAAFAARLSPRSAPVVALLDFPRAEHIDAVRDAGAHTVLGKPFCVESLAEELAAAVVQRQLA